MKVGLTVLTGQRETCHEEKETADTDLEFSSWFSDVVRACLFVCFVFTASRLVWDLFSELTPKCRPLLLTIFIFSWRVSLSLHVRLLINFQTRVAPLLLPGVGEGKYPFSVVPNPWRRFGMGFFFRICFNYHCYIRVTGWPITSILAWPTRGQLAVSVDSVSAFPSSFFFFFFLFRKFTSCYFLTSTSHITLHRVAESISHDSNYYTTYIHI